MIAGIGSDIVCLSRFEKVRRRYPHKLPRRILTESERRAMPKNPLPYLAGRWAAKEALGKALGCGVRVPVVWQNISVIKDDEGAPVFIFADSMQTYLDARGVGWCHLSISHDGDYVLAFVVAEQK